VGPGGSMPGYLAALAVHRPSRTAVVGYANAPSRFLPTRAAPLLPVHGRPPPPLPMDERPPPPLPMHERPPHPFPRTGSRPRPFPCTSGRSRFPVHGRAGSVLVGTLVAG
ncbi:hypothetical protein AB0I07_33605, partial [Polymorphospora rubra]